MGPFHRDQLLLLRPQNSIFGGRQTPQHINSRFELIPDPQHTQSDFFGCFSPGCATGDREDSPALYSLSTPGADPASFLEWKQQSDTSLITAAPLNIKPSPWVNIPALKSTAQVGETWIWIKHRPQVGKFAIFLFQANPAAGNKPKHVPAAAQPEHRACPR